MKPAVEGVAFQDGLRNEPIASIGKVADKISRWADGAVAGHRFWLVSRKARNQDSCQKEHADP
jgi:hypothetical protein